MKTETENIKETIIVGTRISKTLKQKIDQRIAKGAYLNVSDFLRALLRKHFQEDLQ